MPVPANYTPSVALPAGQVVRFDGRLLDYKGRAADAQRQHVFLGRDGVPTSMTDADLLSVARKGHLILVSEDRVALEEEVDHTTVDAIAIDAVTGMPIGRPVVTVRLRLPRLDARILREAARLLTGNEPSMALTDADAAQLTMADLALAVRSDRDADGWLERAFALASGRDRTPSLTLDRLHGMDEVVAWGRGLARDLADYEAGRIGWHEVDKGVLLVGPPGTARRRRQGPSPGRAASRWSPPPSPAGRRAAPWTTCSRR